KSGGSDINNAIVDSILRGYQLIDIGRRNCGDAVQRLSDSRAVAADEDAAVVAENAVLTGPDRYPVGTVSADDDIVLPVAEQHVIAELAIDGVVTAFAVDLIGGADGAPPRGRLYGYLGWTPPR